MGTPRSIAVANLERSAQRPWNLNDMRRIWPIVLSPHGRSQAGGGLDPMRSRARFQSRNAAPGHLSGGRKPRGGEG